MDKTLVKVLRTDLVKAFVPQRREHRHILQLIIALDCFNAADEAFLRSLGGEGGHTGKYICFLQKAGYLAEAYQAFICLDERGWFNRHAPHGNAKKLEAFNAAVTTLRELSPKRSWASAPCRCCGKVHGSKVERRPPVDLVRLRNKGGFHWDSSALRDAYEEVLSETPQPPVFRFRSRRTRDVESPLAAGLLAFIIAKAEDVKLTMRVSESLRLVIGTAVGNYLHSVGAVLEDEMVS